jgi:hypothetical protein
MFLPAMLGIEWGREKKGGGGAGKLNLKYIIHKQNIILDKNISNSIKIHWP